MLLLKGQGDVFTRVESESGEFGVFIRGNGGVKPYRVHARSPAFKNLSVVPEISRGSLIADLIATIASTDAVAGEVDR
jgi:NADH:ubiquinone oxidoreductase 49 kD subunit 7